MLCDIIQSGTLRAAIQETAMVEMNSQPSNVAEMLHMQQESARCLTVNCSAGLLPSELHQLIDRIGLEMQLRTASIRAMGRGSPAVLSASGGKHSTDRNQGTNNHRDFYRLCQGELL